MRRAGFAWLFTIAFVSSVLTAQPQPSVGAAAQSTPGGTPKIHFAKAVPYDSGGPYATSIALADVNGDGKPDLIVANYCQVTDQVGCNAPGQVAVLLGNGDGTFQAAVTYSTGAYHTYALAVGDVNNDRRLDIVVANPCRHAQDWGCDDANGEVSVLLGNGDGSFQSAVTYNSGGFYANSVAVADFNDDGKPDIAVVNGEWLGGNDGSAGVLLGNGEGIFQPSVNYDAGGSNTGTNSVAIADFNNDGKLDLAVANQCCGGNILDGTAAVFLGNGDGTFQPAVNYDGGGEPAYAIAAGDLRGVGVEDLVVASRLGIRNGSKRNTAGVLLGNGDGTFQPVAVYLAGGDGIDSVAIGDINGDGIPDLVMLSECQHLTLFQFCIGKGKVSVLLGKGDGTFQQEVSFGSGGYEGSAIAIGDVNGDGRPDIVVTNACGNALPGCVGPDGTVAVLLNTTSYITSTALTSSPNPSQVGQVVVFTATLSSSPAVPNGEVVTFYNGKTKLGTATTSKGVATLTTSFSAAGKDTIKATYSGDAFRKRSAGSVKQVVNP